MDFKNFNIGRDLLYLSFLFTGAALGCFISRLKRRASLRFKNRCLTLGIIFLSPAAAVFACMLIVTGGRFFTDPVYYITGSILALVVLLAFRFPRAAGFPAILITGLVLVWTACSFGRFPRFDGSEINLGHAEINNSGGILLSIVSGKSPVEFEPENMQFEITITSFEFASFVPVIGGERRGKITEFRNELTIFYDDAGFGRFFGSGQDGGFLVRTAVVTMPIPDGSLIPGCTAGFFYNNNGLAVR